MANNIDTQGEFACTWLNKRPEPAWARGKQAATGKAGRGDQFSWSEDT